MKKGSKYADKVFSFIYHLRASSNINMTNYKGTPEFHGNLCTLFSKPLQIFHLWFTALKIHTSPTKMQDKPKI